MDSTMLKMIKQQNPDKEYPTKLGEKWTIEEENKLLQELNDNINIKDIAESHKRTLGGIIGRQKTIAYRMYLTGATEDEIIKITKLSNEQISKTIAKKSDKTLTKSTAISVISPLPIFSLENEIIEMRNEIKELKTTIKELVEMIKAIYKFEDIHKTLQSKYLI